MVDYETEVSQRMLTYDSLYHPFPSRRMTVYAKNGMVATSQPLAAQAGLEMLRRGGNAVDAAIATAAALTVVEPTSNGIGGDAFALVWTNGKLYGLNASGPAPKALSIAKLREAGVDEIPRFGWIPVTVPGAPAAWAALSKRFGRLPFRDLLEPAIAYAEDGYPLSPVLAKYWSNAVRMFTQQLQGDVFAHWFRTFAPGGTAPAAGEVWKSKDHADTLRRIADSLAEDFYRGELAERMDDFARDTGGYLRKTDLQDYQPEWVEPIRLNYRGFDVWELPPNGQGLVALMALNMLKEFEFPEFDSPERYHRQIEAIKLAFADGKHHITDPRHMKVPVEALLSDDYAKERVRAIGETASHPKPGRPQSGGTVYLAAADGEGNMVSFIQSNYMGFGSGLVVPGTGIALQNRGHTFSLNPEDANALAPGKRTYHTIIPGFLSKDGSAIGPFGVMGGYMQPQGHVQVVMNAVDFHLNPQACLDAPRWQWIEGTVVEVERTVPEHIVGALVRKGHQVRVAADSGGFGRGQIIWRSAEGVLAGGTEPRTDGAIAAW
jgi:gamma-glutamyltranspeptidase/glutathione hydrolase